MTRREVFVLVRNVYISFLFGGVLHGCDSSKEQKTDISTLVSQLGLLLGYFLYGDDLSQDRVDEIQKHIKVVTYNSLRKRRELKSLFRRIVRKNSDSSFQTLSPENKEIYFKEIFPLLEGSSVILEILKRYLAEERVLRFLDYPDLPGDRGECGRLVLEGEIWDRYYPLKGDE